MIRGGGVRRAARLLAVLASVAAFAAFAGPVSADPPGNNGTVKIHIGAPTAAHAIEPNRPHVCDFHVHAWNFDQNQELTFSIVGHGGPTAGPSSVSGTIVTSFNGDHGWEGSSVHFNGPGGPTVQPGHYKLTVDTGNGTPTQDKHKVFWVECAPSGGNGGNGGNDGNGGNGGNGNTGGTNTGGTNAGGTNTGGNVASGQSGGNVASGMATRSGTLGAQGGPGGGVLPDTSVPAGVASSLGAILLSAAAVAHAATRRR